MILGVGTDLCDIRRIEKSLAEFGERFKDRVFTEGEKQRAERRANPAAAYAQRFAAKEACVKALGSGFVDGLSFRDVEVANHPSGQPFLRLHGVAERKLGSLVPPGMAPQIHLSMTDEYPLAHAMVVISAVPA